eukprot:scaffold3402_cov169-Amphora_coffeaeformis.AAC.1
MNPVLWHNPNGWPHHDDGLPVARLPSVVLACLTRTFVVVGPDGVVLSRTTKRHTKNERPSPNLFHSVPILDAVDRELCVGVREKEETANN